jgi:hypothetical protein
VAVKTKMELNPQIDKPAMQQLKQSVSRAPNQHTGPSDKAAGTQLAQTSYLESLLKFDRCRAAEVQINQTSSYVKIA